MFQKTILLKKTKKIMHHLSYKNKTQEKNKIEHFSQILQKKTKTISRCTIYKKKNTKNTKQKLVY